MVTRHILAIGGLLGDASSTAIFQYALRLSGKANPTIGFIATASGDSPVFIDKFYDTFRPLTCSPTHLPLFNRTPDVAEFIAGLDVILVGGGNTISMLGVWRAWGIPEILRRAWASGTVLTGWSAGALCWFQSGLSDAHAGRFAAVEGLGFVDGSCCPHFSQDAARRDMFVRAVRAVEMLPGWGLDNGAALHFEGTVARTLLRVPGTSGATFVSATGADSARDLAEFVLPADG